jgi:hypothetical protein
MNSIVNGIGITLPIFYIFQIEQMQNDYVNNCTPKSCMLVQRKTWMTLFHFKE